MTFVWIALAGGVGAVLRHLLGVVVANTGRPGWQSTVLVNALGSFVVGLVSGWGPWLGPELSSVLGVGLLGGFTTFSTASVDVVRLIEDDRPEVAAAVAAGTLVLCCVCAGLGWVSGGLSA